MDRGDMPGARLIGSARAPWAAAEAPRSGGDGARSPLAMATASMATFSAWSAS